VDLLFELGLLRRDLVGLLVVGVDGIDPELAGGVDRKLMCFQFEVGERFDQSDQGKIGLVRIGGRRVDEHERDVLLE